jgi:hypothetical protein
LTIKVWRNLVQKQANSQFGKFIERKCEDWYAPKADKPVQSQHVIQRISAPELRTSFILFVVIDNLRYDQWKTLKV